MANLEGWHIDPEDRSRFRYHDGTDFTERTTTDISVVSMPIGLFGKRFFSVKAELVPMIFGIVAVIGWLLWYLAGVVFGGVGLWFGALLLRVGRNGMLTVGMVLSALGMLLSLGFWIYAIITPLA